MFLFGANLKMHQTPQQTRDYVCEVRTRVASVPGIDNAALWVAPPFTSIEAAAHEARSSRITVGAQTMHWADEGTFTGEISPAMIKACGASFVMLGHAERRALFGEMDEALNKKVHAAVKHGLDVMLCVGEPAHVKQVNAGDAYVEQQLRSDLRGLEDPAGLCVLYEPLWSVGASGTAADPAYVSDAFDNIRRALAALFGQAGEDVPILYGGSVDATNCANYARLPNCAGIGVGRAGLDPVNFVAVLTNALDAWHQSRINSH